MMTVLSPWSAGKKISHCEPEKLLQWVQASKEEKSDSTFYGSQLLVIIWYSVYLHVSSFPRRKCFIVQRGYLTADTWFFRCVQLTMLIRLWGYRIVADDWLRKTFGWIKHGIFNIKHSNHLRLITLCLIRMEICSKTVYSAFFNPFSRSVLFFVKGGTLYAYFRRNGSRDHRYW